MMALVVPVRAAAVEAPLRLARLWRAVGLCCGDALGIWQQPGGRSKSMAAQSDVTARSALWLPPADEQQPASNWSGQPRGRKDELTEAIAAMPAALGYVQTARGPLRPPAWEDILCSNPNALEEAAPSPRPRRPREGRLLVVRAQPAQELMLDAVASAKALKPKAPLWAPPPRTAHRQRWRPLSGRAGARAAAEHGA